MNGFQTLLFILASLSIPIVIFFSVRKVTEGIIGLLLLFAILFYYSSAAIQVLTNFQPSTGWMIDFLSSYRIFVLDHWPEFNGLLTVDRSFSPTFFPILILWMGGIVRFVVVRFVPRNKIGEITHEYWLYITSFLILLLIISGVLNWNVLITIVLFVAVLLVIAAGIHRIFGDILSLLLGIIRHTLKWIWAGIKRLWIGLRFLALGAAHIAKYLYRILKHIRLLYDKYVRGPFIRLNKQITRLEEKEEQNAEAVLRNVSNKLADISIEDHPTVVMSALPSNALNWGVLASTLDACERLLQAQKPFSRSLLDAAYDALTQFQNLDIAKSDARFQRVTQTFREAMQRGDKEAQVQCIVEGSQIATRLAKKESLKQRKVV